MLAHHPISRPRSILAKVSSDAALVRLVVWYSGMLIPTLLMKGFYIRNLYGVGPFAVLNGEHATRAQRIGVGLLLFSADLREVFLIVAVLYVLAAFAPRWGAAVVMGASTTVMLLAGIGCCLSLQIIGSLLTPENLALARDWARDHPDVVASSRGGVVVAIVACCILLGVALWTALGLLLSRDLVRLHWARRLGRYGAWCIVGLQAAAYVGVMAHGSSSLTMRGPPTGFWFDAAVAWGGPPRWEPFAVRTPSARDIDSAYRRMVYPAGARSVGYLVDIPPARLARRHVIIISLETAPRRYYPIIDNADLPAFKRMSQRAIVSDRHYATEPATTWAMYSMLSGTYPRPAGTLLTYGDFRTDGLATILGELGYETTYIDSYKIDWMSGVYRDHNSRLIQDLGFSRLLDAASDSIGPDGPAPYEVLLRRERRSFARALASVADAEHRGKKALVFVATVLGHFPWQAAPGDQNLSATDKLYALAKSLDDLTGELLRGLDSLQLSDQVLIVVTGDHGLRSEPEFASVHEDMQFGDLTFNVPFLLYAPGLLDREVRLPYATSHVDITPTLLHLCGVRDSAWVHEGDYMLDQRLRDRTTFLMNNTLRPVDGFYRLGYVYAVNRVTGRLSVSRAFAADGATTQDTDATAAAMTPGDAERLLEAATRIFDTTSAYFLQRRALPLDR